MLDKVTKSTPKKQHFVPQFILRNFTSGKKEQVWVFDKHEDRSFPSSVLKAACSNGYYNITEDGVNVTLEHRLASLETSTSMVISNLVKTESLATLSSEDMSVLSLFCSVQLLRTNQQREFVKQFQDSIATWVEARGGKVEDVENFEVLDDEEIKRSHVQNIASLAFEFSELFRKKHLKLVKAAPATQFIISDNPIVMHNHLPRPGRGNLGLNCKGIEVQFPISSNLCLVFVCEKLISEIVSKMKDVQGKKTLGVLIPVDTAEIESFVNALDDGKAQTLKPENMDFHNSLQVIQSSRYVYSATNNFLLVQDILSKSPECRLSPRISSN
ncbi:DUF4238 domain-containing protein [Mariprofundus ferrooxydans]|uniref:DUF4238 domain-containing protein n=1 Tax=Mariprofundus ferrooxydans PV-1 TaxID=314345 RepID=Q0EZY0_9PROT|nr:DUF4238 domain-containing protein [Mariprofundus ferrooxydans]EAU54904.1 hypothetical protein SPV1_09423 [Mariprofundus ferrooxydans PV-1]KON46788.1 hypothetical protein AL013_11265 [Mariprofundus ferrooxydans]